MKLQRTPIIIISILTLLLVGAGVFWYGKAQWTKSQETQNKSADVTIPANQPSASDPQAEQEQAWYQIPELGIEIQLPKDIADDLVYMYEERPITKYNGERHVPVKGVTKKLALFSTRTLVKFDSRNCSLEIAPAGIISREEGEQIKENPQVNSWVGPALAFDSFYVYYEGSQAACTNDQEMLDYNSRVMVSLGTPFREELGRIREIR
ncbi:MAG: hypothetical protein IPK84_03995 [Candidatus Moraniibacteriota bacterium]|nr:MAG: hypothetical protein IPK84_03995 [Candidatus Moranbacteria bacterium]